MSRGGPALGEALGYTGELNLGCGGRLTWKQTVIWCNRENERSVGAQRSSASKGKGRFEKISWRKAGLDREWKEKRRTGMREFQNRGSKICKDHTRT